MAKATLLVEDPKKNVDTTIDPGPHSIKLPPDPILAEILKAVKDVSKRLEKVEKAVETPVTIVSQSVTSYSSALQGLVTTNTATSPVTVSTSFTAESKFPIPVEYREIVNLVLNKKFGVDIDYKADTAGFEFAILVPEEYSNAGKPHWETYKEDRRSKVILNALGVNGVREWATQVYENFGPETKSRITFERSQP